MHDQPDSAPTVPSSTRVTGPLPPLFKDTSFWGMSVTQFLGAFNDNVFKNDLLALITYNPTVAACSTVNCCVTG